MKINWILVMICLAIGLNILDVVTAKRILVGEANPLYIVTQNYWVLVSAKVITILSLIVVYYYIKRAKTGNKTRFLFCMLLIYICVGSGLGAMSNIQAPQEQVDRLEEEYGSLVEAGDFETIQKNNEGRIRAYSNMAMTVIVFPIIFGFLSFMLWEWADKNFKKKNEIVQNV